MLYSQDYTIQPPRNLWMLPTSGLFLFMDRSNNWLPKQIPLICFHQQTWVNYSLAMVLCCSTPGQLIHVCL